MQDDPNMTEYLSAVAEDDMEGFKQSYMTAASFISDDTDAGILAHFNNEAFHTPPLSVNVISNALLRYAVISNTPLSVNVISNALLRYAVISNAPLSVNAISNALLRYAVISNALLRYAAVSNALLRYADLSSALLRYAYILVYLYIIRKTLPLNSAAQLSSVVNYLDLVTLLAGRWCLMSTRSAW